jgi:phytoene dehydrogenase-like protein
LFKEGASFATYANARATTDALAEQDSADHLLWRDFIEDMAALAADHPYGPAGTTRAPAVKAFAAMLSDAGALEKSARLFGPCADILEDYFTDPRVKAHLAAHALSGTGRGEREAGSAEMLTEFLDEDAWRVRTPKDSPALRAVLEQACQDAGVVITTEKPVEVSQTGKIVTISFGGEDKIKVKHVFFATPGAASLAGASDSQGALGQSAHAEFTMRFRLADGAEKPSGGANAIFQIIDDRGDLQAARDAAVQGKLYDNLPIEFEYASNGELIARSSLLPAAFFEAGEWRGWTGQDRQAVAAIIKERLSSRIPDFASHIRRTETELSAPPSGKSLFSACDRVIVQPHRHNAVSAAVKLIDQVMAGNE